MLFVVFGTLMTAGAVGAYVLFVAPTADSRPPPQTVPFDHLRDRAAVLAATHATVRFTGVEVDAEAGWSYSSTHFPSGQSRRYDYRPLSALTGTSTSVKEPVLVWLLASSDVADPQSPSPPLPMKGDAVEGRLMYRELPVFVRAALERRGTSVSKDAYILESGDDEGAGAGLAGLVLTGLVGVVLLGMGVLIRSSYLPGQRSGRAGKHQNVGHGL